jgi:hypothetical protein
MVGRLDGRQDGPESIQSSVGPDPSGLRRDAKSGRDLVETQVHVVAKDQDHSVAMVQTKEALPETVGFVERQTIALRGSGGQVRAPDH